MGHNFDGLFDEPVDRFGCGNMKGNETSSRLREEGYISYEGAEADFPIAPAIAAAVSDLIRRGIIGYTLADEPYISSVLWWMKEVRNWDVVSESIVPTLGTVFALGTATRAFTEPGDGVIVQEPVYNRFGAIVARNGRRIVNNPLIEENGLYAMDFDDLEQKMRDPRNKLFVLCNPHNPIGKVWPRADLERMSELANRHGVKVFSDEIFAEITFEGHVAVPYCTVPGAENHAIVCTSLGKSFNLTGVNHANVFISDPILRDAFSEQRRADHFGSVDPFFYAAIRAAYSPAGLSWLSAMKSYVYDNYLLIDRFLKQRLPEITVSPLEGSFVVWVDFRRLGLDDEALERYLHERARLYLDMGVQYGDSGSGFGRMNIAAPRGCIQNSLDTLERERRMS